MSMNIVKVDPDTLTVMPSELHAPRANWEPTPSLVKVEEGEVVFDLAQLKEEPTDTADLIQDAQGETPPDFQFNNSDRVKTEVEQECTLGPAEEPKDDGLGEYKCKKCRKTCPTRGALAMHMKKHSTAGSIFKKCSYCQQQFLSRYALKHHVLTHTGETPFVCPTCGAGFARSFKLKVHIENVHGSETTYQCLKCAAIFETYLSYARHRRSHYPEWKSNPTATCTICNRTLSQRSSLDAHMLIHTGEKPYNCSFCGQDFRLQNTLKVHQRRKHGVAKGASVADVLKEVDEGETVVVNELATN